MPMKDNRWRSKIKRKPESTSTIKIGEKTKAVGFLTLERIDFPTGIESWTNIYVAFRTKNTRKLSKPKLSLRKYQWLDEGWKQRQTYNVNSIKEARVLLSLLLKWFPDLNSPP